MDIITDIIRLCFVNWRITSLAFLLLSAMPICAHATDLKKNETIVANTSRILDLAISSNGLLAYCEDYKKNVTVYSLKEKRVISTIENLPGEARSLAFSPKGNRLAIAVENGIVIWNVDTRKRQYSKMPGFVLVVRYSHNGKYLVNNFGGNVAIWSGNNGEHMQNLYNENGPITDIQFSWDDKMLAISTQNGCLNTYEYDDRFRHQSSYHISNNQIQCLMFLRKRKTLLVGTLNSVLTLDCTERRKIRKIKEFKDLFFVQTIEVCQSNQKCFVGLIPTKGAFFVCVNLETGKRHQVMTRRHVSALRCSNGKLFLGYGYLGGPELWPSGKRKYDDGIDVFCLK